MPVVGSTAYDTARKITQLVRALLNDLGALSIAVGIANIQRNTANSTVTVTTAGPHNLVPGDFQLVSGVPVGALSFNGTFQVASVISPLQYTFTQIGATEGAAAGQVQGVGIGGFYTDSVLMPYVNSAYREVQRKLLSVGMPLFKADEVFLVVPAIVAPDSSVQVSITDATPAPNQLPVDLLEPLKIWERINGSADDFEEMTDLTEHGGLPSRPQGEQLQMWEWRGDGIYFMGALIDTQIRIRYVKALVDLVDGTSNVGIRGSSDAIAYRAAAAVGGSRGNPLSEKWDNVATDAIEDLVSQQARRGQRAGSRPRPYSRRSGVTPF
jgi:hypothetical protein